MMLADAYIQQCAPTVSVETMRLLIKAESNYFPWAININGELKLIKQPSSYEEAVSWAKWLIDNGYNIDMGLMQVNSPNLKVLGLSVEQALEPCTNLGAGGRILTENYVSAITKFPTQHALNAALSKYNTGDFQRGLSNGYVLRVLGVSQVQPIEALKPSLVEKRKPVAASAAPAAAGKTAKPNPYTAGTDSKSTE